jgi:2-phospho-L-lactate transferase/gluconeogenesis factor (CofD/UPF0052 family)
MRMNNLETIYDGGDYGDYDEVNIVVAGGGSGAATLVAGIREAVPQANLTEIVTVTDDGSTTGELMRRYNTQPVGDLRRGLSAMVADPVVSKLMEHRLSSHATPTTVRNIGEAIMTRLDHTGHVYDYDFARAMVRSSETIASEQDRLRGYTLGNLILTAAAVELGGLRQASYAIGDVIDARGRVIPVSDVHHRLVLMDGPNTYVGEHIIDELGAADFVDPKKAHIGFTANRDASPQNPYLTDIPASADALAATRQAHGFVTGSGSRLTSVMPVLKAGGMRQALAEMDGQVVVVPNLVVQPETKGMLVTDYLADIKAAIGRVDALVYNNDHQTLANFGLNPVHEVRSPEEIKHEFDVDVYARELVQTELRLPSPDDPYGESRSVVLTRATVVGAVVLQAIMAQRQQLARA